jgi:HSP20 family protein
MAGPQAEASTTSTSRNEQAGEQGQKSQGATQTQSATQSDNRQSDTRGVQRQSRSDRGMARPDAYAFMSPFALLQRFLTEDISGIFDQTGSRSIAPATRTRGAGDMLTWAPKVDVLQRGGELVIRADVPGVDPAEIAVDITPDAVIMSGQRNEERVEDGDGVYRVERTTGAFYREIPLPEGANVDQAKASFKYGVLEIAVPISSNQTSRGRRLQISQ